MNTATVNTPTIEDALRSHIADLEAKLQEERNKNGSIRRSLRKTIQESTFTYRTKEYTVKVDIRLFDEYEWKTKKTRIFTSGSFLDAIEEPLRQYYRPFGEEAPEYKAGRKVYRKAQKEVIATALAKAGISFEKVSFSQNAGCSSCPCSPGHVADDVLRYEGFKIENIFITVTAN